MRPDSVNRSFFVARVARGNEKSWSAGRSRSIQRLSKNQPIDLVWSGVLNRLEVKPLIPPLPPGRGASGRSQPGRTEADLVDRAAWLGFLDSLSGRSRVWVVGKSCVIFKVFFTPSHQGTKPFSRPSPIIRAIVIAGAENTVASLSSWSLLVAWYDVRRDSERHLIT